MVSEPGQSNELSVLYDDDESIPPDSSQDTLRGYSCIPEKYRAAITIFISF